MRIIPYLFFLLFLTACTSHSMMSHPQVTSEEVFIAEMIPHHQEAVDSSRMMMASENPAVVDLAQRIIAAQEQEIAMMQGWLRDWYPESTHKTTYAAMMPDLSMSVGTARDRAYLDGMKMHHEGAIQMAKQAQGLELRPEVRALTEAIIAAQEAEIAEIDALLR